jgi:pimeloyl-ACP methyl ester carboxylesterase
MTIERCDVEFASDGEMCRGWYYRRLGRAARPAIILTHGFSATIDQGLDAFGRAFAEAGFAVLVFDYRDLGRSDGDERGRILISRQHDDLRAALAWLSSEDGVDPTRIALWGFSYSGGHSLFVGALDPRVAAIVAVAPALDISASFRAHNSSARVRELLAFLAHEHDERNRGQSPARLNIVAPAGETAVLATHDAHDWFARSPTPAWHPTTTAESVARMIEYRPDIFLDLIAPKPLLVLAGRRDALIPFSQVNSAFSAGSAHIETKFFDCGHFDFMPGGDAHDAALALTTKWLSYALKP